MSLEEEGLLCREFQIITNATKGEAILDNNEGWIFQEKTSRAQIPKTQRDTLWNNSSDLGKVAAVP